ncbi:4'-phosphopantetheinyl transferase superfamily protein [Streptomyces sp. NPDC051940]|uniref:4'-phosphopantetheinyl transferase family protein n=1 Tax=Streptomyces sp. NPDC051940 TaxID=3155675 RepID=UPI0034383821
MDTSTISVWDIDLAPEAPDASLYGLLTAEERDRAARLADPARRSALLRSHAAVRGLLAGYVGVPAGRISWTTGPHGKPALTAGGCEWNLSRSGTRALLAVTASSAVGVDIQTEHPHGDPAALARRFFAAAEADRIEAAPDSRTRVSRLCRLLSRKEAWAKAAGGRLLQFLRRDARGPAPKQWNGDDYFLADLSVGPGFAAAIATSGRTPDPVDYHTCDWRDLCALS